MGEIGLKLYRVVAAITRSLGRYLRVGEWGRISFLMG